MTDTKAAVKAETQPITFEQNMTFSDGSVAVVAARSDAMNAGLRLESADLVATLGRDDLVMLKQALESALDLVFLARKAARDRGEDI